MENQGWKRWLWPLRSRKVQVAAATCVAAYAAQWGFNVSEETLLGLLGVGIALILGIAHEDAGRASVGNNAATPPTAPRP